MQDKAKVIAVPATEVNGTWAVSISGLTGAALFAALTAVGAFVYVPLVPVPVTMQTLFVLLAGAVIGGRYGTLSQVFYIGAGAAGLPIYAGQLAGLSAFTGPTGGYLVSFLIVPLLVGHLLRSAATVRRAVLAFTVGTGLIFVLGVTHLAVFYTSDFSEAFRVGFLPFIPGAIFKIFAATSILGSYRALRSRRHA